MTVSTSTPKVSNKEWRLKTNKVEKKLKLERKVLKKGGEIAKI